ncbi:hypothetical protein C2W64_03534 [Brevibacillus laterosporus]|nr:hypothetical protein C2W64_03534 [Brevibacillus laterosporus]
MWQGTKQSLPSLLNIQMRQEANAKGEKSATKKSAFPFLC